MTMTEYKAKLAEMKSLEYRGSMPKRGTKARQKYDQIMEELEAAMKAKNDSK